MRHPCAWFAPLMIARPRASLPRTRAVAIPGAATTAETTSAAWKLCRKVACRAAPTGPHETPHTSCEPQAHRRYCKTLLRAHPVRLGGLVASDVLWEEAEPQCSL